MVDLPGLVQIVMSGQASSLEDDIRALVKQQVVSASAIILAVCKADDDMANSVALRLVSEVDPDMVRT